MIQIQLCYRHLKIEITLNCTALSFVHFHLSNKRKEIED